MHTVAMDKELDLFYLCFHFSISKFNRCRIFCTQHYSRFHISPPIEVRPCKNQVDDLIGEIRKTIEAGDRILVTTLTKRMAEELSRYLDRLRISCSYIHSEVKTLDRIEIIRNLREGVIDVLVGVNLLREGLDLPEVSLVAVMDADKEGFLRSNRSLTQTAGRAARNVDGRVLMYADKVTDSMAQTIEETSRRREKQEAYNKEHGITPQQVKRSTKTVFEQSELIEERPSPIAAEPAVSGVGILEDPVVAGYVKAKDRKAMEKLMARTRKEMERAAKELAFMDAARLRDELFAMEGAVANWPD